MLKKVCAVKSERRKVKVRLERCAPFLFFINCHIFAHFYTNLYKQYMCRKCHHRMKYNFSIHIHFLQDADRVPFNFYTETWQGRRMMTNWQGRIEESKWRRSSSTGALFVLNQTEKLVLSCPCRRNKRGKISLLCFFLHYCYTSKKDRCCTKKHNNSGETPHKTLACLIHPTQLFLLCFQSQIN